MEGHVLNLRCGPFEDAPDPRFYFPAAGHEQARTLLKAGAARRRGLILLTGAPGSGKTVLCRTLLSQPGGRGTPLIQACGTGDHPGLIRRLCQALEIKCDGGMSPAEQVERLKASILDKALPRQAALLMVLDQAENLSPTELDELTLLRDLDGQAGRRWRIIMAGRPEVTEILAAPCCKRLARHIHQSGELGPLTEGQVATYINHRLRIAGHAGPELFQKDALGLVFERTGGNPRLINQICRTAILAAGQQGRTSVDRALVEGLTVAPQTVPADRDPGVAPHTLAVRPSPDVLVGRIENACSRAQEIIRRLEDAVRRSASISEEAISQAESLDMACHKGTVTGGNLSQQAEGLAQTGRQTQERITVLGRELKTGELLYGEVKRLAADLANDTRTSLDDERAALDAHSRQIVTLIEQLETTRRTALETSEETVQRLRDETQRLASEHTEFLDTSLSEAQDRGRDAGNEITELIHTCSAGLETLRSEVEAAQEQAREIASATRAVREAQSTVSSALEAASTAAARLRETVVDGRSAAEQIEERVARDLAGITNATGRLETALTDGQRGAQHVEHRLQTCISEATAATECVRGAVVGGQGQARQIERTLQACVSEAEAAKEHLRATAADGELASEQMERHAHTAVAEAAAATDKLNSAVADAEAVVEQIEERTHVATGQAEVQLKALTDAAGDADLAADAAQTEAEAARDAAKRTAELANSLRETNRCAVSCTNDAKTATDRLCHAMAEGRATTEQIERLARDGAELAAATLGRMHDTVADARAGADQIEERVRSAVGEAETQLGALTQATSSADAAAQEAANRAADLTDTLREAGRCAVAHTDDARSATDRLSVAVAEGQATAERMDEQTQSVTTQVEAQFSALSEAASGADLAASTLQQEIGAAQEAAARAASLTSALSAANHRAASGMEDATAVTDRLVQAVADGQAAAGRTEQRANLATSLADMKVTALTEAVSGAKAAENTLHAGIGAAEEVAAQITSLTDTLDEAKGDAAAGAEEAAVVTDRLRQVVAEGQAATELAERNLRSGIDQAGDRINKLVDAVSVAKIARKAVQSEAKAVEQVCHQAASVRDELSGQATRLSQTGKETQERMTCLGEQVAGGERVYNELRQLTTDLAARTQASIDGDRALLEEHAKQIVALIGQMEEARRSSVEASEQSLRSLRDETVRLSGQHREVLDMSLAAALDRGQALSKDRQALIDGCAASLETLRTETKVVEERLCRSLVDAATVNDRLETTLAEGREDLEQGEQRVRTCLAEATTVTGRLHGTITDGQAGAEQLGRRLQTLVGEAGDTGNGLREAIDHGRDAAGQIEQRIQADIAQAATTSDRLQSTVAEAKETTGRLQGVAAEGRATAEQIEQQAKSGVAAIEERISKLTDAKCAADASADATRAEVGSAEEVCKRAAVVGDELSEQADRLARANHENEDRTARLGQELAGSQRVYDELKQLTADLAAQTRASIGQDRELLDEHAKQIVALIEQLAEARRASQETSGETLRRLRDETHRLAREHTDILETSLSEAEDRRDELGIDAAALIQRCGANLEVLKEEIEAVEERARQTAAAEGESLAAQVDQRVQSGIAAANDQINNLTEVVNSAFAATSAVKQEVQTARDAANRSVSLTEAANAANRRTASCVVEATTAADGLHTALADAQDATGQFEQRMEAKFVEADHRVNDLSETLVGAERAAGAVRAEIGAAREAMEKTASHTAALQDADRRAGGTMADADIITERLLGAVTEGQAAIRGIEQAGQRGASQANQRLTTLTEVVARADAAAGAAQQQTEAAERTAERARSLINSVDQAAETTSQRVDTLVNTAEQTARQADSVKAEATAAADHLRGIVADGKTAADAIEHRLHNNISDGREVVDMFTEILADTDATAQTLEAKVRVAEETSELAGKLTDALHKTNAQVSAGLVEAHSASERLLGTIAEAHATVQTVQRDVEMAVARADQTTESWQHKIREAVSDGEVAAEGVRRRVETVVALADQEAERIEAQRGCAAEASASLDEQLRRADAAHQENAELLERLEAAAAAARDHDSQCAARTQQMEEARDRLEQSASHAANLLESLTAETPQLANLMIKLEDRLSQAGNADAELGKRVSAAREAQERCQQQATQAGQTDSALTDSIEQAGQLAQHLAQAVQETNATLQQVAEQEEAVRATVQQQQAARDEDMSLLNELQQRGVEAAELAAQLSQRQDDVTDTCQELDQRTELAAEAIHEIAQQVEAVDARREILDASERTLADFVEQAENINSQLERIQKQADEFEQRLNPMIDRPAEIAAEAKTQAAQLQRVCRAVRKVFAGLSEATLQAKQRGDEFRQTSKEAETRTNRLTAETARAAATLRTWVEEAVRVQARLADYLARCPGVDQTHPADSLRSLASMTDLPRQAMLDDPMRMGSIEPISPEEDVLPTSTIANASADKHKRAEQIARLLQEANKFADTPV